MLKTTPLMFRQFTEQTSQRTDRFIIHRHLLPETLSTTQPFANENPPFRAERAIFDAEGVEEHSPGLATRRAVA